MLELAFVADQSDTELLERVYGGDREAEEMLLARHRSAVEIVPGRRPFLSVEASGRAALWWIPEPGHPMLPVRVVWLALRAQGRVPEPPPEHAETWAAYTSLAPAQRLALWHREVEGQRPDEIARHLALTAQEAAAVLESSYVEIARLLSARAGELRSPLAEVVLGPGAADYLARRPRVAPLPDGGAGARRRPGTAVMSVAAASVAVAALVLMLANPGVSPAPDRGPVAVGDPVPGTVLRPVELRVQPSPEVGPAPVSGVSGDQPGPGAPTPEGPPATPEPSPPSPPVDPGPGGQAPVDVHVTAEGATVQIDPGVVDSVEVEVSLPAVPALGG